MVYSDIKVGDVIHRTFLPDVDSDELVWHRDRQDRLVYVREGSGWWFQFDNEMPFRISKGSVIRIPAMTYHRILKQADCSQLDIEIQIGNLDKWKN